MIGVLVDQDVGHRGFGRQAALDQPRRRQSLHHHTLAGAAGVLGPARHQHAVLSRDDVKPLGPVLADPMHRPVTARASRAVGLEHLLDPRQVGRQGHALGLSAPRRRSHLVVLLLISLGRRDDDLEVFQRQGELGGIELLGAPAELGAPQRLQHRHQPLEPTVALGQFAGVMGSFGQEQGTQCGDVVGQIFRPCAHGLQSTTSPSQRGCDIAH